MNWLLGSLDLLQLGLHEGLCLNNSTWSTSKAVPFDSTSFIPNTPSIASFCTDDFILLRSVRSQHNKYKRQYRRSKTSKSKVITRQENSEIQHAKATKREVRRYQWLLCLLRTYIYDMYLNASVL